MSDSELFIIVKLNYKTINSTSSKISISSEIYNTATKNFISSWSTPRKIINFSGNRAQNALKCQFKNTSNIKGEKQVHKLISGH